MPTIECPLCHSIDQAQRVTAIVGGETHDTRGDSTTVGSSQLEGRTDYYAAKGFDRERIGDGRISAGSVNYSTTRVDVTQQSRLAKKLARPAPPVEPDYSLGSISEKLVMFLAAIPAFLVWVMTANLAESLNVGFIADVLLLLATFIPTAVVWGSVGFLISEMILRNQYPAQERNRARAQYDYEKKRWDTAMQRWSAMFYCRRCDVVYLPDDTFTPVSPEDTIALAYAGTEPFAPISS